MFPSTTNAQHESPVCLVILYSFSVSSQCFPMVSLHNQCFHCLPSLPGYDIHSAMVLSVCLVLRICRLHSFTTALPSVHTYKCQLHSFTTALPSVPSYKCQLHSFTTALPSVPTYKCQLHSFTTALPSVHTYKCQLHSFTTALSSVPTYKHSNQSAG